MNLRRYVLVYLAVGFGLALLSIAALALFSFDIANGGMVIIPPMAAAMVEGQRFAQQNARLPDGAEMWRFSRLAALVTLAVAMIVTVLLGFVLPDIRALMSARFGAGILMGAVVAQALLSFLVTRYFLGLGARSALNSGKQKGGRGK